MSTAVSQPLRAPTEPFGQTGIRQYFGSFLALASAVGVAVSLSMWARSYNALDMVDLFHSDSRTFLRSGNGRFLVARAAGASENPVSWSYNSRPNFRRGGDSWEPSIWKTIGFEMRFDQSGRDSIYWWLRVRWPTAALLLAVWPTIHAVLQLRGSRPARQVGFELTPLYCGRCGRPVAAAEKRCGHCGRERT